IAPDHALKFCGQAFAAFSSRSSDAGALIGEAGRYIAGRTHRFTAGLRQEGCERILEAVEIPNKRIKVRPGRIHGLVGGAADRLFGPAERLHDGCARLGALCAEVGLFHASPYGSLLRDARSRPLTEAQPRQNRLASASEA